MAVDGDGGNRYPHGSDADQAGSRARRAGRGRGSESFEVSELGISCCVFVLLKKFLVKFRYTGFSCILHVLFLFLFFILLVQLVMKLHLVDLFFIFLSLGWKLLQRTVCASLEHEVSLHCF